MQMDGRMDRWTEIIKLVVTFCTFVNMPKNRDGVLFLN
jgi:hypothetical protein